MPGKPTSIVNKPIRPQNKHKQEAPDVLHIHPRTRLREPSNLTFKFKTTRGKMKSDIDSQERQRTIVSRSTVECMHPSPPPPKKKKIMEFYF